MGFKQNPVSRRNKQLFFPFGLLQVASLTGPKTHWHRHTTITADHYRHKSQHQQHQSKQCWPIKSPHQHGQHRCDLIDFDQLDTGSRGASSSLSFAAWIMCNDGSFQEHTDAHTQILNLAPLMAPTFRGQLEQLQYETQEREHSFSPLVLWFPFPNSRKKAQSIMGQQWTSFTIVSIRFQQCTPN